jgi:hypothetical protein
VSIRLSFACEGRSCDETVGFTLANLAGDVREGGARLVREGWIIRPHQREPRLRVLCPACATRDGHT